MRKIIVTEFITLDGVIEAPGGDETPHLHAGWQSKYKSPEGGKYKMDELASVDGLLLGKNTFEAFASYWPSQKGKDLPTPSTKCQSMSSPQACQRRTGITAISSAMWTETLPH
ncbi:MAG: dihydrofolate reductase family protein [Candidatus Obscuribacter sp.]|nr:dihydrofolate reductase family protein [Candidatus Obscuribacter sp.]